MRTKKTICTFGFVLALTPFLMANSCSGNSEQIDGPTSFFLTLFIIANQFNGSCKTTEGACTNFTGSNRSGCVGNESAGRCTSTSSIGSCTQSGNLGAHRQIVYYTGGIHGTNGSCTDDTQCELSCTGNGSSYVYSTDYSG